jgi:hypothetical protein
MTKRKPKPDAVADLSAAEAEDHARAEHVTDPAAFEFPFPPAATESAALPVPPVPPADATATRGEEPPAAAGDRRPPRDPFGIAKDYLAGVRLLESRQYRQVQLAFDQKPSEAVIAAVKEGGFKWNGPERVWTRQLGAQPVQVRTEAERLFERVAALLRDEKGVGRGR